MEWHVEVCNYKIVVFFFCETPPQVTTFMRDHFIHCQWLSQGEGGGKGAYAANFFMIFLFFLFFFFLFFIYLFIYFLKLNHML